MTPRPYAQLVQYKRWADRGLYEVIDRNLARLAAPDAAILLGILDHIHVVDRIFQHHLQGLPHAFRAPRSDGLPEFHGLAASLSDVDEWYASYVESWRENDPDQSVDFVFTDGTPARMTRGEILLHVCLHGTYHRGNAGILLQKNGVAPNDDRMTDFLATAS
jgi:uncharacterized damage-inducible protein DinB